MNCLKRYVEKSHQHQPLLQRIVFLLQAAGAACSTVTNKADDLRTYIPAFVKDSIYLSDTNRFASAKAVPGRYFFYDRRLSVNQTKSCASCHAPAFSFSDGDRRSIGALGDNVQRTRIGQHCIQPLPYRCGFDPAFSRTANQQPFFSPAAPGTWLEGE